MVSMPSMSGIFQSASTTKNGLLASIDSSTNLIASGPDDATVTFHRKDEAIDAAISLAMSLSSTINILKSAGMLASEVLALAKGSFAVANLAVNLNSLPMPGVLLT